MQIGWSVRNPAETAKGVGTILLLFGIWLCVTAGFTLPDELNTVFTYCCGQTLPLDASNADIQAYFGGSDAGSYARGGALLIETGHALPAGGAPMWSPGVYWIQGLALWIAGPDGPTAGILVAFSILSWTLLCTVFSAVARQILKSGLALAAPALLFLFPATREFLLGIGAFYSETIAISLFGTGLLLIASAQQSRSWKRAIVAGLALVAAAYTRAAFEVVMSPVMILTVLGFGVWLAGQQLAIWARQGKLSRIGLRSLTWPASVAATGLPLLLLIVAVFYAATLPYKAHNAQEFGSFRWTFTDYYFAYPWMPDGEYTSGNGFILTGGGNVACRVDLERCAEFVNIRNTQGPSAVTVTTYKHALFETMLHHPFAYFMMKTPYVLRYWISTPTFGEPNNLAKRSSALASLLILAGVIAALVCALRGILWPAALLGGYLGGTFVTLMIFHLEARYLFPLQTLSPVLALVGAAPLFRPGAWTTLKWPARLRVLPPRESVLDVSPGVRTGEASPR